MGIKSSYRAAKRIAHATVPELRLFLGREMLVVEPRLPYNQHPIRGAGGPAHNRTKRCFKVVQHGVRPWGRGAHFERIGPHAARRLERFSDAISPVHGAYQA